ncbi:MAG: class I SAM-dependent methyltransferase [Bacteroidetes bacterium]|nr:class I SAM-dependent methyltransferase [Bacteroidota bacterium]
MNNILDKQYNAHETHYLKLGNDLIRLENKNSIDFWGHERMYKQLLPFFSYSYKWLTVGDGIGTDANWLFTQGENVVASDIADSVLEKAKAMGFIDRYSKENAENLSFEENSFDCIICKEAYHHFPRPYIALYEMIRVASTAVILIEPIDVGIKMPFIVFTKNILDRINVNLINKIWKNRYSFESVGNYVYKISEREIEKVAMGIGLPAIAYKGINSYWIEKFDLMQPLTNKKLFKKVKRKIRIRDVICRLGIIPYQMMSCVIFKKLPTEQQIFELKKNGYKYIQLPENPYLT